MKSKLLFFLLLLFPLYLISQNENDKIVYLDSTFQKTEKENHVYCRIIRDYHLEKENYKIEEFYKSGNLKKEGFSADKEAYKYFGFVTSYYENGNVQEKITYKDAQLEGSYFSFYENGNKRVVGENIPEKSVDRLKIYKFWDENGNQKVTDGYGVYEEVANKSILSGSLVKGKKDGIWKGVDTRLKIQFTETYNEGVFVSGISIDDNLIEHSYTIIDEKPKPMDGVELFYSFIGKNFKTPKNNTIIGKIFISFTVDKNGYIKEVKIARGLSEELDTEALRVFNSYTKKWQSGKSRGIDVDVKYTCPVSIK